jgi:hypothetical protein
MEVDWMMAEIWPTAGFMQSDDQDGALTAHET